MIKLLCNRHLNFPYAWRRVHLLRLMLAWYADNRLQVSRFHLREHVLRAGAAFFSTPEIKQ